ncbi:hypothetical protein SPFM15_00047 [Salmonella phage SPFM15]|nr:hypothetical protein SPFM5_00042 [Salmonella phage SPFM5]VFR13671.1 hypothetical protein SPFM15_00047 [Salmonella phage SPFM15]
MGPVSKAAGQMVNQGTPMSDCGSAFLQNAALRSRLYSWRPLNGTMADCGPMFAAFNVDYEALAQRLKDKPVKIVVTSELKGVGLLLNNTIIAGTNNANWTAVRM